VIGSLTMLIIEKQHDMAILGSMGASRSLIRKIFFAEGMFITFIGAFAGILLGTILSVIQQRFGIIGLGNGGSFVIDAYPVKMQVWILFMSCSL
jgi:lipoprotein-releasing system permease protein